VTTPPVLRKPGLRSCWRCYYALIWCVSQKRRTSLRPGSRVATVTLRSRRVAMPCPAPGRGLFLCPLSPSLLLVSIIFFLAMALGFQPWGLSQLPSELPSNLDEIFPFLRCVCHSARRFVPFLCELSPFPLSVYIRRINLTQLGFLSTFRNFVTKSAVKLTLESHATTSPPLRIWNPIKCSRVLPDPKLRRHCKRSLQTELYPADPLGIQLCALLVWFLIGRPRRAACLRRVWSRIQRFSSSLRDGLTGMIWVLLRNQFFFTYRDKSQRPITFHQHGASVGSFGRVKVCFVEMKCQSNRCQRRFPNVLSKEVRHVSQSKDPSPTCSCCRCERDAQWILRLCWKRI